jgi:hypothetical protein
LTQLEQEKKALSFILDHRLVNLQVCHHLFTFISKVLLVSAFTQVERRWLFGVLAHVFHLGSRYLAKSDSSFRFHHS